MNKITVSSLNNLFLTLNLFLIGFFASWGGGLQSLISFDISKVFVFSSISLILHWFLVSRFRFQRSNPFHCFIIFLLFHVLISYVFFFRDEFVIGYAERVILQEGIFRIQENIGMLIFRLVLYVFLFYALLAVLNEQRIFLLMFSYSLGLASIILLGGYQRYDQILYEYRLAGGVLDPNAFGFSCVTAFFFLVSLFFFLKNNFLKKLLFIFLGVLSFWGVISSGSRGALLGLFFGLLVFLFGYRSRFSRLVSVFALILFLIGASMLFSKNVDESFQGRFSFSRAQDDRGAGRLDIWNGYLKKWPEYVLVGKGFARSREVIKDQVGFKFAVTHNIYLEVLVEFGIIGLLLFLSSIYRTWITFKNGYISALFSSFIMISFFLNTFSLRETWIVLAIVISFRNIKSKNSGFLWNQ